MAKAKKQDESLEVDEKRLGVGPNDNVTPAQEAQKELDAKRLEDRGVEDSTEE